MWFSIVWVGPKCYFCKNCGLQPSQKCHCTYTIHDISVNYSKYSCIILFNDYTKVLVSKDTKQTVQHSVFLLTSYRWVGGC